MPASPEDTTAPGGPATFGELLSGMMRDVGLLLRQEATLARVELAEKAVEAKGGLLKAGLGVALGMAGLGTLSAAAVLGLTLLLSTLLPPMAAAFIGTLLVGAALGAGAYFLFQRGLTEAKAGGFLPERTLSSLKENAQWASKQLR